eukprot:Rhum_TRINITY_DN14239_c7_g2::Rhum_TRINITY_DN14239_c7_g2_i1::g.75548::m.75548
MSIPRPRRVAALDLRPRLPRKAVRVDIRGQEAGRLVLPAVAGALLRPAQAAEDDKLVVEAHHRVLVARRRHLAARRNPAPVELALALPERHAVVLVAQVPPAHPRQRRVVRRTHAGEGGGRGEGRACLPQVVRLLLAVLLVQGVERLRAGHARHLAALQRHEREGLRGAVVALHAGVERVQRACAAAVEPDAAEHVHLVVHRHRGVVRHEDRHVREHKRPLPRLQAHPVAVPHETRVPHALPTRTPHRRPQHRRQTRLLRVQVDPLRRHTPRVRLRVQVSARRRQVHARRHVAGLDLDSAGVVGGVLPHPARAQPAEHEKVLVALHGRRRVPVPAPRQRPLALEPPPLERRPQQLVRLVLLLLAAPSAEQQQLRLTGRARRLHQRRPCVLDVLGRELLVPRQRRVVSQRGAPPHALRVQLRGRRRGACAEGGREALLRPAQAHLSVAAPLAPLGRVARQLRVPDRQVLVQGACGDLPKGRLRAGGWLQRVGHHAAVRLARGELVRAVAAGHVPPAVREGGDGAALGGGGPDGAAVPRVGVTQRVHARQLRHLLRDDVQRLRLLRRGVEQHLVVRRQVVRQVFNRTPLVVRDQEAVCLLQPQSPLEFAEQQARRVTPAELDHRRLPAAVPVVRPELDVQRPWASCLPWAFRRCSRSGRASGHGGGAGGIRAEECRVGDGFGALIIIFFFFLFFFFLLLLFLVVLLILLLLLIPLRHQSATIVWKVRVPAIRLHPLVLHCRPSLPWWSVSPMKYRYC